MMHQKHIYVQQIQVFPTKIIQIPINRIQYVIQNNHHSQLMYQQILLLPQIVQLSLQNSQFCPQTQYQTQISKQIYRTNHQQQQFIPYFQKISSTPIQSEYFLEQKSQSQIQQQNGQFISRQQKKTQNTFDIKGQTIQNNYNNILPQNHEQEIINQQIPPPKVQSTNSPCKIKQLGNSNQKSQSPLRNQKDSQQQQKQKDDFLDQLKKLTQITPTIKIFYEKDIYYEGESDQQGAINGKGIMHNVLNTLLIPQPSFKWKRVEGFFMNGKLDGKAIYYDDANKEYKVEYDKGLFIRKLD
ncbi:hypothetical protein pb186bvf_008359 [Paramecium bursaria]